MLDVAGAVPLLVALGLVATAVLLRLRQAEGDVDARTQDALERARAELAAIEATIASRARVDDELREAAERTAAAQQELARLQEDVAWTRKELATSAALLAEQRAALRDVATAPAPVSASGRAGGSATSPQPSVRSVPGGVDLAAVRAATGPAAAPLQGVVNAVRPDAPAPIVSDPDGSGEPA